MLSDDPDSLEAAAREELGTAILEIAQLQERIQQLQQALRTAERTGIEIGILMNRDGLSFEQAVERLGAKD